MQAQKNKYHNPRYMFLDGDGKLYWNEDWGWSNPWAANYYWMIGYLNIGYAVLTHMGKNLNDNYADPREEDGFVRESPSTVNEKSSKHIFADLNFVFNGDNQGNLKTIKDVWTHNSGSKAAHRLKRSGVPDGCNRGYLDGHVEWILPSGMGYQDDPENSPHIFQSSVYYWGKYDYARDYNRETFW